MHEKCGHIFYANSAYANSSEKHLTINDWGNIYSIPEISLSHEIEANLKYFMYNAVFKMVTNLKKVPRTIETFP